MLRKRADGIAGFTRMSRHALHTGFSGHAALNKKFADLLFWKRLLC